MFLTLMLWLIHLFFLLESLYEEVVKRFLLVGGVGFVPGHGD
jgi:hypothetical protein